MSSPDFRKIACAAMTASLLLAGAAVGQPPKEDDKDAVATLAYNAAGGLQNNGFYERAAARWTAFIKNYPEDSRLDRVHYYLGICQLHTKQYDEAIKTFQAVLSKYPQFKSLDGVRYNLAMAQFEQAKALAAEKKPADFKVPAAALADMAAKHAESAYAPRALYFQAEALYLGGETETSAGVYQKLIAGYPKSPLLAAAHYYLGVTQQELAQHEAAAKTFAAFLANADFQKHELAAEIRVRLGNALFNQEKHKEAAEVFAPVIAEKESPFADLALLRLGQCQMELEDREGAIARFQALLKDHPKSQYAPAGQLALGKCYFLTDKHAEAQAALGPLADQKLDESAEAAYWLGRTLLEMKKPADALARLEAAVQAFTEGEFAPYLKSLRIDALYDIPERRKETQALYAAFVEAHQEHPLAAQNLYMAGYAALGQEDYETARKHAEAFLAQHAEHELRPENLYVAGEACLLAADSEKPGGDLAKAEQYYRELVGKHAEHARAPRAHLRIGWCLHKAEKYPEAVQYLAAVVPKLPAAEDQAEGQLQIGRAQAAAEKHKEAVAAYDAAIQAKPDWERVDEVLLASAQSLQALDNPQEATKRLTQLISSHPDSKFLEQATYELGEIAQSEQQYDAALARYQEVLAKFPEGSLATPANYGLAACYYAKGDFQNAITPLGVVVADKEDAMLAARGLYLRGLTRQRLDQHAEAITDLQAFLATKPGESDALDARYAVALSHVGLEQRTEAVAALEKLIADKPDYEHIDDVYYELGHAQLASDQPAKAVEAFTALVMKTPDSPHVPEAHFHLGKEHESAAKTAEDDAAKQASWAKAEAAYAAGLAKAEVAELKEKLAYKLGDMQFQQAKYEQAAATLAKQIADHPQGELVGPARYLAGETHFAQVQYDKAYPLFVQVAADKIEDYHADSLYRAGECAARLKNWPASGQHYTDLIAGFKEFPLLADARYGLAFALVQQSKPADARPLFQQVAKEGKGETAVKAVFMLGELAFNEKKHEDAIEQFLAIASGGYPKEAPYKTWLARANYEAARCFLELGRNEQARKSLETVVKEFPDEAVAKDAQQLLTETK